MLGPVTNADTDLIQHEVSSATQYLANLYAWLMWDRNIMFIYLTNACEMYNYTLGILKNGLPKSE